MCNKVTEEWGKTFEEFEKEGGLFWNKADVSVLYSHHMNWNLLAFLPELSHFDLERNSYKTYNKNKIIKTFKILK